MKRVFWFSLQLLSETILILARTERDMIKNSYRSSCKVPLLFLSDFNETSIFSTDFSKIAQMSNLMKIRPVAAKMFHADGQTDMNQIVTFRNFANAPKNVIQNYKKTANTNFITKKMCLRNPWKPQVAQFEHHWSSTVYSAGNYFIVSAGSVF